MNRKKFQRQRNYTYNEFLIGEFTKNPQLTRERKKEMAAQTNLTPHQIYKWWWDYHKRIGTNFEFGRD